MLGTSPALSALYKKGPLGERLWDQKDFEDFEGWGDVGLPLLPDGGSVSKCSFHTCYLWEGLLVCN